MRYLNLLLIPFTILFFSISTFGQAESDKNLTTDDEKSSVEFNIGADLMSRYVWRGTQYGGNAPSIQPGIDLAWKGLNVGFWGAYSLSGSNTTQELDFYISYTFAKEMFTVLFTDYYFLDSQTPYKFYDFEEDSTAHVLEGTISFNGTDKIPVSLLVAVNFYGADAARIDDDPNSSTFNTKTGIQYSTYLELNYSTKFLKSFSFDAFAGFNLTAPKKEDSNTGYLGESGFYASKAGLVNIGMTFGKEIPITSKYNLPVSASVIANPISGNYFFIFGISL